MDNNQQREIDIFVFEHWEWVKNRVDRNNIKYSAKYTRKEHDDFVRKWIKYLGLETTKDQIWKRIHIV